MYAHSQYFMEPLARIKHDLRLSLPGHALFVGGSLYGKTTLALHLLTNPQIFTPKPARILLYYDQMQSMSLEAKRKLEAVGIQLLLFKGLTNVNLDSFKKSEEQTVVLIDDHAEQTSSSTEIGHGTEIVIKHP